MAFRSYRNDHSKQWIIQSYFSDFAKTSSSPSNNIWESRRRNLDRWANSANLATRSSRVSESGCRNNITRRTTTTTDRTTIRFACNGPRKRLRTTKARANRRKNLLQITPSLRCIIVVVVSVSSSVFLFVVLFSVCSETSISPWILERSNGLYFYRLCVWVFVRLWKLLNFFYDNILWSVSIVLCKSMDDFWICTIYWINKKFVILFFLMKFMFISNSVW